jgi:hypothetical protein
MNEKIKETVLRFLGLCAIIIIACFLVAFPVMLLWNWLMPEIFGLPVINFWQALGLCVLSSLLLKSGGSNEKKDS